MAIVPMLSLLLAVAVPPAYLVEPNAVETCKENVASITSCQNELKSEVVESDNDKSYRPLIRQTNLLNSCYGLETEDAIQDCVSINKYIPLPTRPRLLGGSGPKKTYIKILEASGSRTTFVFFPDPIASSPQGIAYEADCLARIWRVVDDDGNRRLGGHFEQGSAADFACHTKSSSISDFRP